MQVKINPALAVTDNDARRAFEYTVLPARIRDGGEIVPGYSGQPGCMVGQLSNATGTDMSRLARYAEARGLPFVIYGIPATSRCLLP